MLSQLLPVEGLVFQELGKKLASTIAIMSLSVLFNTALAKDGAKLSTAERVEGVELIWKTALKRFPFREKLQIFKQQVEFAKLDVMGIEDVPRYTARLQELVATLDDGHTFVLAAPGAAYRRSKPSVGVERIAGVPLITWVRNDLAEMTPLGSRVVSIDSQPVDSVVNQKMAQVSASTAHQRLDTATSMAFEGERGSVVEIEYDTPNGERRKASYERGDAWPAGTRLTYLQSWERVRTEFRQFDDGRLAYFSARDFKDISVYNDFLINLGALQAAKAVIFDVRKNSGGSSRVGYEILSHFISSPVLEGRSRAVNAEMLDRDVVESDSRDLKLFDLPRMAIEPKPESQRIQGRLLVLTDHDTVSAAEDFVSIALLLGAVQVGEVTAGSTGEMVRVALPGGGSLFMVSKWDQGATGVEFVNKGFAPQVAAAPTQRSLVAGQDLGLLSALQMARQSVGYSLAPPQ